MQQPDVTAYVNDALKNGTEVSAFQSTKLADDGKGTMFWSVLLPFVCRTSGTMYLSPSSFSTGMMEMK